MVNSEHTICNMSTKYLRFVKTLQIQRLIVELWEKRKQGKYRVAKKKKTLTKNKKKK